MEKNTNKNNGGFIGYMRRTIKLKIVAIMLTIIGIWVMNVSMDDATGGVFFMMLAIPMFFIDDKDDD